MKKLILKIFCIALTFAAVALIALYSCCIILMPFYRFNLLRADIYGYISIGFAILFAIFVLLLLFKKNKKLTKVGVWIRQNLMYVILLYVVITLIAASIDDEVKWTTAELKEFISLQWVIFGLSIAIYVLAQSFLKRHISDNMPKKSNDDALGGLNFIENKLEFYVYLNEKLFAFILCFINLIFLLLSTSFAYLYDVDSNGSMLFLQSCVIVSFYLCTNTLIMLFMHIIKPIFVAKKEVMKTMNITNDEIEYVNKFNYIKDIVDKLASHIEKIVPKNINDRDRVKNEMVENCLKQLLKNIVEEEQSINQEENDNK